MRVVVAGRSGFVGSAVSRRLLEAGHTVEGLVSPRLDHAPHEPLGRTSHREIVKDLTRAVESADAVVNCAGLAGPASSSAGVLHGANAVLPALLARASTAAGVGRLVHVSSAAVLGRGVLGEGVVEPSTALTPYARSKAAGEVAVLEEMAGSAVVLRPTSVHGPDRSMTRSVAAFARSPWSFVALEAPTPHVLVDNVASAVDFLVGSSDIPAIALQPAEGLTTVSFLTHLGLGRAPRVLPAPAVRAAVRAGLAARASSLVATSRRLELLAFGQAQETGWLTTAGYRPTSGPQVWRRLGTQCAEQPAR